MLRISSGADLAGALRARAIRRVRSVAASPEGSLQRGQAALPAKRSEGAAPTKARLGRADTMLNRSSTPSQRAKRARAPEARLTGLPARNAEHFWADQPTGSGVSPSAERACLAASCSAAFFDGPLPMPSCSPSTRAAHVKRRSCGGPSVSTISYLTDRPYLASASCSSVLWSTKLVSA